MSLLRRASVFRVFVRRRQWRSNESVSERSRGGYALLLIPATTFALGVWQTKRRTWKLNLIADLQERTSAPIRELPQDLSELESLEFHRMRVYGEFDHSKEILIGPRSFISKKSDQGGGLFGSSEGVGWLVITPLLLRDRPISILVNRGWVPKNRANPTSRAVGQVKGEVQLVGVVRKTEKREQFTPKNQEDSLRWSFRDVDAIAAKLGTAPVYLDADADSSVPNGPVGGQTRVTLRNDHLSYLITWFSLSAATFYMWLQRFVLR